LQFQIYHGIGEKLRLRI